MTSATRASLDKTPIARPGRTRRQRGRAIRLPALLFALCTLLAFALGYFQSTSVRGIEFNTRTWEIREFSFHRDPFTNFQFSGVLHQPPAHYQTWSPSVSSTSAIADVAITSHLKSHPKIEPRWDLVRLDSSSTSLGKADILVELLEAQDHDYSQFWPKWSVDQASKAAVFWPAVQHLVLLGAYARLPAIFELALLDSSLSDFQLSLTEKVQAAFLDHCQRLSDRGDTAQAKLAAEAGLTYGEDARLQAFLER